MAVTRGIVGIGGVRQETGTTIRGTVVGVRQETVAAGGANQTVNVPLVTIVVAAQAPTANRTQSIAVPAADIAVAGQAPSVNVTRSVVVPVADIAVNAFAPTANRTASVVVPAANIDVNAFAPTTGQGQSVSVPAADIAVAANAPVVNRTQSILVPEAPIIVTGYAPIVTNSGVVPAQALAELYGGNIFTARKKKKKKDEEPTLEEKIELIGSWVDDGKQQIAKALPREQRRKLPEPDLVPIEMLVRQVMQASQQVREKVEALYEELLDEDDEVALSLLFDMQTDSRHLRRKKV